MRQDFQMQQQGRAAGSGGNAFLTGLFFGIILGIIGIAVNLAYTYLYSTPVIIAGLAVLLIGGIVFYTWPAVRSSRRSGKVGSGVLAGLVSACVSYLIGYGFNVFLTTMAVDKMRQNALTAFNAMQSMFPVSGVQFNMTNTQIQQNSINSIGGIVVVAIIGLIFGLIGGLIGRSRSRRRAY